ncbi:DUF2304 domain-containing protein, partial [Streptococcus ruminantium]
TLGGNNGYPISIFTYCDSYVYFSFYFNEYSQVKDSNRGQYFFGFFFSGVLLVFAFLPNAISQLSDWIGIESPANFVFLAIIFLLI